MVLTGHVTDAACYLMALQTHLCTVALLYYCSWVMGALLHEHERCFPLTALYALRPFFRPLAFHPCVILQILARPPVFSFWYVTQTLHFNKQGRHTHTPARTRRPLTYFVFACWYDTLLLSTFLSNQQLERLLSNDVQYNECAFRTTVHSEIDSRQDVVFLTDLLIYLKITN